MSKLNFTQTESGWSVDSEFGTFGEITDDSDGFNFRPITGLVICVEHMSVISRWMLLAEMGQVGQRLGLI